MGQGGKSEWCQTRVNQAAIRLFDYLVKDSVVSLSRQFHARRSFRTGIVMAGEIIAAIEKCNHIFLVERLIAGLGKIGWNARKIKVYSVALRHRIDPVEIADPLVLDQRRNRTLRNR